MINLYITKQGVYVRIKLNQLIIEIEKEIISEVPIKTIESVTVVGNAFLTTQTISQLVKLKIPISYISVKGYYKFSIRSDHNVNISRQELQFLAFQNEEFSLNLSKIIIQNKVKNQLLVLKRYNRNTNSKYVEKNIKHIKNKIPLINLVTNKQELLGVEGIIAKFYFNSFKFLIPEEFAFTNRLSYPSTDPFNALLSFGYTLLLNSFITALENKKINPYKGFMHANKIGHPALASDLMEEYRPLIIDSLALNLVRRNIIKINNFYKPDNYNGFLLENEKIKIVIDKYNDKINTKRKYIKSYTTDTKNIIYLQIQSLINAFTELNEKLFFSVNYR